MDFGIRSGALEYFLKTYGQDGKKELIQTLAFLIYFVETEWRKLDTNTGVTQVEEVLK